ncbi:MAG TPA: hypothetical protein VLN73_00170, partial [Alphaproteobacteria bacterium]|nr:hypothetical protein [Alphaproteobacteria bacterium]
VFLLAAQERIRVLGDVAVAGNQFEVEHAIPPMGPGFLIVGNSTAVLPLHNHCVGALSRHRARWRFFELKTYASLLVSFKRL